MSTINVTDLQRQSLEVGHLFITFYPTLANGGNPSWTTMNGEIPKGTDHLRVRVDLRRYGEFRFHFVNGGASGANTTVQLMYATTKAGSQTSLGAAALALDGSLGDELDTGWTDIASLAQIEGAYLGLFGAVAGSIGVMRQVTAEFRGKPS